MVLYQVGTYLVPGVILPVLGHIEVHIIIIGRSIRTVLTGCILTA